MEALSIMHVAPESGVTFRQIARFLWRFLRMSGGRRRGQVDQLPSRRLRQWTCLIGALACIAAGTSLAKPNLGHLPGDCGDPFSNAYGPFDYRTATLGQKRVVEANHFTQDVELLRGGQSSRLIAADIDYTLRVFPNHARALMSMIRLGQRMKTSQPQGALFTIECYLSRAIAFRPDDPDVLHVRGVYYATHGSYEQAIEDFSAVIERQPDNGQAHYNRGLAYFESKLYERAREEAKLAKSLGVTLPGLANKLKTVGLSLE